MKNINDNSNISFCDSAVLLDGTPPSPGPPSFALPSPVDSVMSPAMDLRKRTISDVSSDEAAESLSSSAPHHLALLGCRVWAREGPKKV